MTALRGRPIGQLGRVFTIVLFALTRVSSAYDLILIPKQRTRWKIYRAMSPDRHKACCRPAYYWWEAGALMGTMIDYWYYTGDDTWNDKVVQALMHQVGEFNDYMPDNQTLTEGNDDQGFWGLAVMSAAEQRFPDPPEDQPGYLGLAQAVFNTQAARWDPGHCGGGLRWQIFNWNKGFDYKNTISQGCFFALAARLALYTGNSSYADWAERTWDWTKAVGFIDDNYSVFDGAHIPTNCTNIVPYQWSYNVGVFINGASAMYNFTGSDEWKERLDNEKGGPIDQRSGSDLDSSRNSEVPTPVPMQKGLTNSRRALNDGAIDDKNANVIQREMSGGSGSGGSGWATPVSEAGQRDSNRLSRKSMLSSTIN
ncbi:mannan endo-1,6-alpha-mannosidase DCW1 [Verticillium alfalfae VaMs.102]|uniref:mannan endo-1,6-alpha-mannosidase n=1 Tax=Verticillium alfalfae (strain VaMs.102 / ATCC MYA-4576 / FGSC 10136) TaxID=526221 RepID=C9S9L0_VERA1|nr:mannan endo-1,6-alpha-mannosidase DCW1 [Verticillium alfalfae VaMs.102]EEY16073.1 mannan endo-1,6-alpha-mannosidase DCW1 [Verticillium alfalfae VaMs.102]